MGTINITTEPVEISVNGTTFFLDGDPTNSPTWAVLLEIKVVYTDAKKRQTAHNALVDALEKLAATPEDAAIVREWGPKEGTATIELVCKEYAKAVLGFPTKPQSSSMKA